MVAAHGRYDVTMFAASIALVAIGTLLVFSTTGRPHLGIEGGETLTNLRHQAMMLGVGGAFFVAAAHTPIRWIRALARVLLPAAIVMLVLVLIFGEVRLGARRWFRIGPITIQPSEIAKVGFALYLAGYLQKRRTVLNDLVTGIVPMGLIFLLLAGLIGVQPDVGSVVLLAALVISMLIAGGARLTFLGIAFLGLTAAVLVFILTQPEKVARFVGWLIPEATRMGEGYHIYQSQILIGTGGLFGSGLGEGIHHQLGYLPQSANDFIFSVAAEELGFVGVVCIVLLYVVIAVRGFMLARACRDDFSRFAVFALTLLLTLPAFVHMAVDLGILPTKGLVCPGLSSGGTAMAATMGTLGLLQRFHVETTAVEGGA
jgi:cell division protein FtsW